MLEEEAELEGGVVSGKEEGEVLMELLEGGQLEGGRDGEVRVEFAQLDEDGVGEGEVRAERE